MTTQTPDKDHALVAGPVERLFERLFEAAIARGEVAAAVHMGWRTQRRVAWEVTEHGQLYALNRSYEDAGISRRFNTSVRIKDLETLQRKAVEFRQIRVAGENGGRLDFMLTTTMTDIVKSEHSSRILEEGAEDDDLTVSMTIHMEMPETVIAGLTGIKVSQIVDLPEVFGEISEMTIEHSSSLSKDTVLCSLINQGV